MARLVRGLWALDDRHHYLNHPGEPDEIEAGVVLARQPHPVTERVTLNFDA